MIAAGPFLALLLAPLPGSVEPVDDHSALLGAGGRGGRGLALYAGKVLTMADDQPVIDRGVLLVRDGKIDAIGSRDDLEVPADFAVIDLGEQWLLPGLIDLHCHIAGSMQDINGAVYQANPGLRVETAIVPDNEYLRRAVAAGVTTVLFIPGSATTIGGQSVLLKTYGEHYEDLRLRAPAGMKLAQADNPKRWGWGMGRLTLNWHIRHVLQRGLAAAREAERSGEPIDPQWEIFASLADGTNQIAAHTQQYQVVYSTLRIVKQELGLDVFVDHGTMDGFHAAGLAQELGVPAILGPRSVSRKNNARRIDHDGKTVGVAAAWQERGHTTIGFNTDAPVVAQEQLPLQAAMGARYGFDDSAMQTLRGLTIVPARTVQIDDRVGSLEVGKDADLIVVAGHPIDPRNRVEQVFVEGRLVYDAEEGQRF